MSKVGKYRDRIILFLSFSLNTPQRVATLSSRISNEDIKQFDVNSLKRNEIEKKERAYNTNEVYNYTVSISLIILGIIIDNLSCHIRIEMNTVWERIT